MKALPGDFPIAVHPGEILAELLEEHDISQLKLAQHLKMDAAKINEICRGKRGISGQMAVALGKAFQMSPSTWMNLQKNWELSQVDTSKVGKITAIKMQA